MTRVQAAALDRDTRAPAKARAFVSDHLDAMGMEELADRATLAVTELVTNVLLHTRSRATVTVLARADGARVSVHDDADLPPVRGVLDELAMSGRGLVMVEQLSQQWGVTRIPGAGKEVWFEVTRDDSRTSPELSVDQLLIMWDDDSEPAPRQGQSMLRHIHIASVPTARLVAAKSHVEDLVRDLTLVAEEHARDTAEPTGPVALANRLQEQLAQLGPMRHALHRIALHARTADLDQTPIDLDLAPHLAEAVDAYRDALDEADVYCRSGELLVTSSASDNARFRRWYLTEIAHQLRARPVGYA